ncbi:hypothetical protein DSO57_1029024 [Entomophthora muscae]|uniref:Uncharacterized protein n=2 Tax=Entomophthora muscae TaxID=34485 RepID=A0ACC2S3D8_9FUNG|nr:hypothetical protein DSO57_1026352 [Entomophthora muscae]KAJ9056820.1 hypothetical protein DSO57_1029024 [Entomophthora muscae]
MNRIPGLLDLLHRGAVFAVVGFTIYATAETYVTFRGSIDNAKTRMELDKQV